MKNNTYNSHKSNKIRILIMDDEWYIRNALTKLIRYLGYEVSSAKNGAEAITLFKEKRPFDIAILDLIIIGGTGGEAIIRQLKQITPDIKAIASGDLFNDRIISDYKNYGFCAILIKPYGLDELKKVLDQVISQN